MLIAITVVWGTTFLATQLGMRDNSGPLGFLAARLGCAAFLLAAFSWRTLGELTRREVKAGAVISVGIVAGLGLQAAGMQHMESSKSAFLTALYVPLVPLIERVLLGRRLPVTAWLGAALAFGGLACMAGISGLKLSLDWGEGLTVGAAVVAAFEILVIGYFARGTDPRRQAVVQLSVGAVLAMGVAWALGEAMPRFTPTFLACAGGLGVASAFIQAAMNWAQQTVPASRATIIYALEPVWAAVFGRMAGERLGPVALAGAGMILASLFVSGLKIPAHMSVGRALTVLWARLRRA